jgi:hypothetical protein
MRQQSTEICGNTAMQQWVKKAYVQARAGTPFEKIFPKFHFCGTNGDYALREM